MSIIDIFLRRRQKMRKYWGNILVSVLMSIGIVGCSHTSPDNPDEIVLFTTPKPSLQEENRILKALFRALIERLQQEMQENGKKDVLFVNIPLQISDDEVIVIPIFFQDKEEKD